ncbi:MAG: methylated-DNA--[protein]-cysteine S-methyltransferase [Clostridiales bacterium]|jgi:methylated-DNA-[protein]-cysteine S-methyltransferase|nr:methylated-DNA--[protein]-cysteine S-methyltransferase [Clostridiales bacterium]
MQRKTIIPDQTPAACGGAYSFTAYQSPIGKLTLAGDGRSLVGLWIEGQKYYRGTLPESAAERDGLPVFDAAKDWLNRYFAGEKPDASELPLNPAGGAFRQRVWRVLLSIPYGGVITYGRIAERIAAESGQGMSAQAVGGAVGHNPISVIIPCHRVVGSDGSLTGYAGGIAVKAKLLELEGADMGALFVPQKGTAL